MDAVLTEGFRWVEVAPPGSDVSVAIVASSSSLPAGVDTGIRFVTTDAEAEHAGDDRRPASTSTRRCCGGRVSRRCSRSATTTATRTTSPNPVSEAGPAPAGAAATCDGRRRTGAP